MKKNFNAIAISAIWYERFLECSRTQGTSEYPASVWRFYHSLLNLGNDKIAIKDKVDKYLVDEWKPEVNYYVEKNTTHTTDVDVIEGERKLMEASFIHKLFNFIAQTIQDSGIGWSTYQTNSEAWDYDDAIKD